MMSFDIISFGTKMTTEKNELSDAKGFSSLPLGLLLGRISGELRTRLLAGCGDFDDDARLIGLTFAIDGHPGETQAYYARFLGIDLNTTSRLISRAEDRGILDRVPSERDRRAHVLVLTSEGRALAQKGAGVVADIEADLRRDLDEGELDAFRRSAEIILRVLS